MKILGITGGSGSGKSKICKVLEDKYNAFIINTDIIGHTIISINKKCINEIINCFGESILDNNYNNPSPFINRKLLGNIVFNDINKLKQLNNITHKYIIPIVYDYINSFKYFNQKLCVIDCALLLDTELKDLCTDIWIIDADINVRLERIMKRDNISKEYALSRINSLQINIPLENSYKVIYNNDNFINTIYCIENYIKELLK